MLWSVVVPVLLHLHMLLYDHCVASPLCVIAAVHSLFVVCLRGQMDSEVDPTVHNVSYEARLLKKIYMKLRD